MMKKTLLLATATAAAAASFAAPVSAAEVKAAAYADLRYGIDYFNDRNSTAATDVNFENHGSNFGFKGSTEQAGIIGFGGYERWLDADTRAGIDLVRQAYAGVRTVYGTLQFGTFASAYMESGRKLDPFFATGAAGTGHPDATTSSFVQGGQSHGLSALTSDIVGGGLFGAATGGFIKNQVAYTSPTLYGVTVNGGVMFDDDGTKSASDDFAAGAEFNGWGITAGVQAIDANSVSTNSGLTKGTEAYRVYGGYNQKRYGGNVSAEKIDLGGGLNNEQYLMASGWYGVLEGTRVAASYGQENETASEGRSFRVGVFYDVLDNFTTHVVYRNFNSTVAGGIDDQVISVGASYKFELSGTASSR